MCTLHLLLAKAHLKLMRMSYTEETEQESFKALKVVRE
jgi:hypothetical protein